jgi:hypothetical protein
VSWVDEPATYDDDPADQGARPSSSLSARKGEQWGHPPSSARECGRTALLRDHQDGSDIAARLFCKTKRCPDCGPRRRARLIDYWTAETAGVPLVRAVIARGVWATMRKRLDRARAAYLKVPAPGGCYVVLASGGIGEPVSDNAAAVVDAFASEALDLARVSHSRSRTFQDAAEPTTVRTAGVGQGDREPEPARYELRGMAMVPLGHVIAAAADLGYYQGRIPDRELPPDWAEAHRLALPEPGTADYKRFGMRIGLHWPDRSRHSRARAA